MRELPTRKRNRLAGYDYSNSGCYFVTICIENRHEILWDVPVGANFVRPLHAEPPALSKIGIIVDEGIQKIERIYDNVQVNEYVIMPNHLHMILALRTVSNIVKQYKEYVTKQLGFSIWQRSFHDRIIRDEDEHNRIAQYIASNPMNWNDDCFRPANLEKNQQ